MDAELARVIDERNAVLDRVRSVLISGLLVRRQVTEIDPDTPLFGTGLGLDSVDAVELLVCLEREFGVELLSGGDMDPRWLRTVNTLADLILEVADSAQRA